MCEDHASRYRLLGSAEAWAAARPVVDEAGWRDGVERLHALGEEAPAWSDMIGRGMLLAAAYHSGGLAGCCEADDAVGRRLVAGVAGPGSCGPVAEPHVVANHAALLMAAGAAVAPAVICETWIRRLHAVACRPQDTHPVPTDHGVHEHVLGHGDYKHHPNDVRTGSGHERAFVPVSGVASAAAGNLRPLSRRRASGRELLE